MANAATLAARQLAAEEKGEATPEATSMKIQAISQPPKLFGRRIVVSVPLRNALFHALRTENLPPQSKRHSNRTDTIHFKLE